MSIRFRFTPARGWKGLLSRSVGILMILELTASQTVAVDVSDPSDSLTGVIWRLGLVAPGAIDGAAWLLKDPNFTARVLMKLDANGDGLTFDEVLGADLLAVARQIRRELKLGDQNRDKRDPRVGTDRALRALVNDARGRTAKALALGLPFEELPAVQVPDPGQKGGDPTRFLSNVPPPTVRPALEYLHHFLNELDLGVDFAGGDAALNAERRRVLTENAGHMLIAFDAGVTDVVVEQLLRMRTHIAPTPGAPGLPISNPRFQHSEEKWITGRRASRILDQIDATLALLGAEFPGKL